MKLYRLKLHPLSPWLTPWQADTLVGLLCWAYARTAGSTALKRDLLDGYSEGKPPFILSDAFPGDLFPVPEALRLVSWPIEQRKTVKRAVFMMPQSFSKFQQGGLPTTNELISRNPFRSVVNLRNTLDRITDTTGEAGSLYSVHEQVLEKEHDTVSIYIRIFENRESLVLDLFHRLAETGFGADVTVGRGQFEVLGNLEPVAWLESVGMNTDRVVSLSTFQPNISDPVKGCWQSFVKYGKLGPDFGFENVFKRPLMMLRPGACFHSDGSTRPWVGRAIQMDEFLSPEMVRQLRQENIKILHVAYGLTVPYVENATKAAGFG